jgi:type IV pilus assembly protein PilN
MIRINLLSVEKPTAATASSGPKFSINLSEKAGPIAAIFVLVGCAGWIAFDYLNVQHQDTAITKELAAARAEKARLDPILREVERFEAQKKDLQERVTLIEELRQNQVGPVHMLDQISRSLPDRLWLLDMKQTGNEILINGKTSTLSSLADFVANLEASGYFAKPVEITNSEEMKAENNAADLIKFAVKATFEMPGSKKATDKDAPAAGAAPARRLAE